MKIYNIIQIDKSHNKQTIRTGLTFKKAVFVREKLKMEQVHSPATKFYRYFVSEEFD